MIPKRVPSLVIAAAAFTCSAPEAPRGLEAEEIPAYMRPPVGATGIRIAGHQGAIGVSFRTHARYPPAAFLAEMLRKVPGTWTPRVENRWNPGIPTSHVRGWTDYRDLTTDPESWVFRWSSEWENEARDLLSLDLQYRVEGPFVRDLEAPSNDELRVIMNLIPATIVAQAERSLPSADGRVERTHTAYDCRVAVDSDVLVARTMSLRPGGGRTATVEFEALDRYFDPSEQVLGRGSFCRDGMNSWSRDDDPHGSSSLSIDLTPAGRKSRTRWIEDHGGLELGYFVDGSFVSARDPRNDAAGSVSIYLKSDDAADELRSRLVGAPSVRIAVPRR